MSRRNALLEWLDQTRRLSKSRDYMFLHLIDRIYDILWYVNPKVLLRHKEFLDDICERYHKDNPLDEIRDRRKKQVFFKGINRRVKQATKRDCTFLRKCDTVTGKGQAFDKFLDGVLFEAEQAEQDVLIQWFEVIDFIWDRPELISPTAIDEYTEDRINYVCTKHRKKNPLKNGVRKRLGKFWRGDDDKWYPERRKRF